ncbi:hypothetical protein ACFL2H_10545 [Planctomycetota bacterium]
MYDFLLKLSVVLLGMGYCGRTHAQEREWTAPVGSSFQLIDIVVRPAFQREVELLPHQTEELNELLTDIREKATALSSLNKGKDLRIQIAALKRDADKTLKDDILVDRQVNRLTEIALQSRRRAGGLAWVLRSEDLAPEVRKLKVTGKQLREIDDFESSEDLDEVIKKMRVEFESKIKAMRLEHAQASLSVLTDEQQEMLVDILGKPPASVSRVDSIRDRIRRKRQTNENDGGKVQ